jgi:DNA-nicking Smr family endonuclease
LSSQSEKLTPDERELFNNSVKDVKPLSPNNKIFSQPLPRKKHPISQSDYPLQPDYCPIDLDSLAPEEWVESDESIQFHRSGLQQKLLKKLTQGQMSISGRIDLHRLNSAAAITQVEVFLRQSQQLGRRCLLIIHGKGKKSAKPILKNLLNIWLRTQASVLAFHSAQPQHGGTGAVYVLIKLIKAPEF